MVAAANVIWDQMEFDFPNGRAQLIPVDLSEKGNWVEVRVMMQLNNGEKAEVRIIVHKFWDRDRIRKMIQGHYMSDKKFWEHNREKRKLIIPNSIERN